MVQYRRNYVAGGTYFLTITLRDRRSNALVAHIEELRRSFRQMQSDRPFTLDAWVILPDHLHVVCTLPPDDADFSGRVRALKSRFTRALASRGAPVRRGARGEYDLWQRRFWEHTVHDEDDLRRQTIGSYGGFVAGSCLRNDRAPSSTWSSPRTDSIGWSEAEYG